MTSPNYDLSALRDSIEKRRAVRKRLRDNSADLARSLARELRSGDRVTIGVSDDPWTEEPPREYGVDNFLTGAREINHDDSLGSFRVINVTLSIFYMINGNDKVALFDPRKDEYENEDTGERWQPVGRVFYETEALGKAPEELWQYTVRLATDDDLLIFATDAPVVLKGLERLLEEQVARMEQANQSLEWMRGAPF